MNILEKEVESRVKRIVFLRQNLAILKNDIAQKNKLMRDYENEVNHHISEVNRIQNCIEAQKYKNTDTSKLLSLANALEDTIKRKIQQYKLILDKMSIDQFIIEVETESGIRVNKGMLMAYLSNAGYKFVSLDSEHLEIVF